MHIQRLMDSITKIDSKYIELIFCVINDTIQEIIDLESFQDNGPQAISTPELLKQIADKTNQYTSDMFMTCILEFCLTNNYLVEGESWNFINYFLEFHKKDLTAKEREYFKALNNSYMSIYKVASISRGKFVILQDQIQKNPQDIKVTDKSFSKTVQEGQYIATRIIHKNIVKGDLEYDLSSSIIPVPKAIINNCVNSIRNITDLMSHTSEIEDSDANRLLIKKMWVKEILENIYLYYTNYQDYHDILDYDGNPWHPCIIQFDINASVLLVKKALSSIKEFMLDEGSKNTWLWLSKKYQKLDSDHLKAQMPDVSDHKAPLLNGAFITNKYNGQAYHIFAEIKLVNKMLLVHVNSKQRANIAQEKIQSLLNGMILNATIYSKN